MLGNGRHAGRTRHELEHLGYVGALQGLGAVRLPELHDRLKLPLVVGTAPKRRNNRACMVWYSIVLILSYGEKHYEDMAGQRRSVRKCDAVREHREACYRQCSGYTYFTTEHARENDRILACLGTNPITTAQPPENSPKINASPDNAPRRLTVSCLSPFPRPPPPLPYNTCNDILKESPT